MCCFPPETTVVTKQGVKRLDQLCAGDEILTLGRRSGSTKWTKFYAWGHREAGTLAEFIVLDLSNGQQLKISSQHLLFVEGETGRKLVKTVAQVCKGDNLFHVEENGTKIMKLVSVVGISSEDIVGIYAPFTMSGHFLANGILVGCYADVGQDFKIAHATLAPLRLWYRMTQSPTKSSFMQDGIHGYAQILMKVRDTLKPSHSIPTV